MRLLSWLPPSAATFIYTVLLKPKPLRKLAHLAIQRIIPEHLDFAGVTLALNQNDAIVSGNLALGCYETFNLEFFQALVRPGMRVLDIGANIGVYSAIAASRAGASGRVIAVEPSDANCAFIRRTKELNNFAQLTVLTRAAAERSGPGKLFLNEENKADHRTFDADGSRSAVAVEFVTVDDLVSELGLERVDVMKIDVQGSEAAVLAGMQGLMAQAEPLRILMEFWPWGISRAGASPAQVLDSLREAGFVAYEIDGDKRTLRRIADATRLLTLDQERDHVDLFLLRAGDPVVNDPAVRAFLA